MICERCGRDILEYYWQDYKRVTFDFTYIDECTGEEKVMKVCWECDHEIINGDELQVDEYSLWEERQLHAYECDPINNDPPPGYFGC